jgi:hypothetical protein
VVAAVTAGPADETVEPLVLAALAFLALALAAANLLHFLARADPKRRQA